MILTDCCLSSRYVKKNSLFLTLNFMLLGYVRCELVMLGVS